MTNPLNKMISITDESLSALEYAHQALKSAEAAFKALKTIAGGNRPANTPF